MALDTQIPPWLQHNITQKNDSPWLINALEQGQRIRQRQAEFPLHLQQMQLQNQATELAVEHQGMVNEQTSISLSAYRSELPMFHEWAKATQGNPKAILNSPVLSFTNPQLQKQYLDLRHAAAETQYGIAMKESVIRDLQAASEIVKDGGRPVKRNEDGTVDQADLAAASAELNEMKARQRIDEILKRAQAESTAKIETMKAEQPFELEQIRVKAQAEAQAKQQSEHDSVLVSATNLAALKSALRQSERATSKYAEMTPELQTELDRQQALKDAIEGMEAKIKGRERTSVLSEKNKMVDDANRALEQAVATGDQAAIDEAQAQRDRAEALAFPKGTRLSGTNPVTGKTETRIVGGTTPSDDEMTTQTKSRLQQQVEGSVQAAKTLHDMEQKVNWSTVGPIAWTAEKLGRFGPGTLIGQTGAEGATGRAEIRGGKLDVLRHLETKGHASKTVLDNVEATLPSLGLFENPTAARAAIVERKRSAILEGITAARQLGQKPPGELIQLLSTYPDKELLRMLNTGLLTAEDAKAAHDLQLQKRNPTKTPLPDWAQPK